MLGKVENATISSKKEYVIDNAKVTFTEKEIENPQPLTVTKKQIVEWLAGKPFEQIKLEELKG